ncbi:MAG: Tll0287-like domain-containing protein [Thermoanaerobaculia bacterium]
MKVLRILLAPLLALPLTAAEPPAPEALASQARGLAGNLMLSLQGELFAAIKSGGPVKALEVCRSRAPEIATATAMGTPWRIARTSSRVRNGANAPDEWEARKLEEFATRLSAGEELGALEAWEVVEVAGRPAFRYMKAIGTASPCLTCHGSALKPEIASKVRELYPDDRAVGFAAGDLRGAFTLSRPL